MSFPVSSPRPIYLSAARYLRGSLCAIITLCTGYVIARELPQGGDRTGVFMSTGKLKIDWAAQYMPVLASIRKQFEKDKPFKGMTIGMALHVEAKTANLVQTLAAGGAKVYITGCNPLSTQDDVAAALNEVKNVHCYAKRGCTVDEYLRGHRAGARCRPVDYHR